MGLSGEQFMEMREREENDFDGLELPAHDWQIVLIEQMMMYAKIPDNDNDTLKMKLNTEMTYSEAEKILIWLDQYVDKDFRSAKAINDMVNKKMNDPAA